jgi:hypothetical protein
MKVTILRNKCIKVICNTNGLNAPKNDRLMDFTYIII